MNKTDKIFSLLGFCFIGIFLIITVLLMLDMIYPMNEDLCVIVMLIMIMLSFICAAISIKLKASKYLLGFTTLVTCVAILNYIFYIATVNKKRNEIQLQQQAGKKANNQSTEMNRH